MNKNTQTGVQYLVVDAAFATQRIDNFLMSRLKGVPKMKIYRIIRKGEVRVNKKRVQPSYRLVADDQIRVPPLHLKSPAEKGKPSSSLLELLKESILYEDKNLLIINKPSGIAVHSGSGISLGVVEALRCLYPKLPNLELAHRLDRDTSGCLILAKKPSILKEIHEILRSGKMVKIYWAFTKGFWKPAECRVDVSLKKNHLSSGERIVKVDEAGKEALTVFKTIKAYKQGSLVEARLYTGRTHQIRVHALHKGHPIAGDEKYGDRDYNKAMKQAGIKRLFLHARSIQFTIPSLQQKIQVTAPMPLDLEQPLEKLPV